MKVPRKWSIAERASLLLYKNGAMLKESLYDDVSFSGSTRDGVRYALIKMVEDGQIFESNGVIVLSPSMQKYYDDKCITKKHNGEIVPARQPIEFKPITKKHIPSVTGSREGTEEWAKIKSRFF